MFDALSDLLLDLLAYGRTRTRRQAYFDVHVKIDVETVDIYTVSLLGIALRRQKLNVERKLVLLLGEKEFSFVDLLLEGLLVVFCFFVRR